MPLYFLRKSQEELIREQNRLLQELITKTEIATKSATEISPVENKQASSVSSAVAEPALPEVPEIDFTEDVPVYIPMAAKANTKIHSLDAIAAEFDDSGLDKLRKAKKKQEREE